MDHRDGRGSPSPNLVPRVDVRVVLFMVNVGRLLIALEERDGFGALPRSGPELSESLDATGTRILVEQVGIAERYLEQLYSISHGS